jgi:C4-dicarboxylate-binding protein DctP
MHEVQKYVTLSDHGYLGYAVIVNKKFWDGLPADIRQQLESALEQATRYANQIAKVENDNALAEVKKSGKSEIIALNAEQKKAWKKALVKVHEQMGDRIGKDLIQSIYKETGFDPAKL